MKDNRMDNIVEGVYNMDNGYVEVWFTDGNMLRVKCEEVEAALRTTEQSLAKLHRLLDNKPIEYVAMALSGEMQASLTVTSTILVLPKYGIILVRMICSFDHQVFSLSFGLTSFSYTVKNSENVISILAALVLRKLCSHS